MAEMQFDYAAAIWESRPKPFSTTFNATTFKRTATGAAAGAMAGGLPGAAVGAGLGATFGILENIMTKVNPQMKQLEQLTRKLVDQYKDYSPIISRLNHQWRLLDRNVSRMWAKTLAPLMKQFTAMGTDFRQRWEKMKVDIFQAIEPFLKTVLTVFGNTVKTVIAVFEFLSKVLVNVIAGFTKLMAFFGLVLDEKEKPTPTKRLKAFPVEWPEVEGPLTGAMRRTSLTEPPFTEEGAQREKKRGKEKKEKEESPVKPFDKIFPGGMQSLSETLLENRQKKKKGQAPGVNVEIKVNDSKELTSKFEQAWRIAAYELRKVEAIEMQRMFALQQESAYT